MTVMNEIQKGACLTIGALAKALRDEGRLNEAKRITSKLEDWLRYHNESEFQEIYRPREKRSLDRSYEREDNHARIKRTLIHALGNAAHPDSLPYLQSYMKHDEGMPSLRRAASHALRHYTCQESASSLLRASLYDPEDVVRHTSFDVYSRHPQRKTLTKDQEDMILE
ncbi:uncharacterized protein LOC134249746 [Saccostrea cucullata]|uniref:uncharacterized protein LOC134249746 n=1 Tax=Saccostrea cuccullata TaxID=36930 RepID=UPI002ED487B0